MKKKTYRRFYLSVKQKFFIALFISILWTALCTYLATGWIQDIAQHVGMFCSLFIISFIALIPGFMNMFACTSYFLDSQPEMLPLERYPKVTILIPAYNEEAHIVDTVRSALAQRYNGDIDIIVIDDGSQDKTFENLTANFSDNPRVKLIKNPHQGKSYALNTGLKKARSELIVSLDADSHLIPNSVERIVTRLKSVPKDTVAVAGSVYPKNPWQSFMTRLQQWDYFFGIAAVKRIQSMMQGTLVAQGAFSLYKKSSLQEIGGWPPEVGEDIVVTWALLKRGYRVSHAVDAIVLTNLPVTYMAFFHQRCRWARGMLEAFRQNPEVLHTNRLTTFIVYWDLLYPLIDLTYLFIFIPGIIAAFFGYFLIAGPMTLAVIPLAILFNIAFFTKQRKLFRSHHLKVKGDAWSLVCYVLFYNALMVPACICGYFSEMFNLQKKWGTK